MASRIAAKESVRRLVDAEAAPWEIEVAHDQRGVPVALVRGQPIPVSLSHSDERAAAACDLRGRVGVDVESLRPLAEEFSRYFLNPDEEAALREWDDPPTASLAAWTVKEAVLKSRGLGLTVPPKKVMIRSIGPGSRVAVTLEETDISVACWRDDREVVAVASAGPPDISAITISRSRLP